MRPSKKSPVIPQRKLVGLERDITKEKEIDKAKTEFVSLASHQLRTPLSTISWYTEMLLAGDVGKISPPQKKYLEEIYQGNQRMIELVNLLLNVSRIELGTFKAEPKPIYVITLFESILDEQKVKIANKKLIITKNFNKSIPVFLIDPNLFVIVFQNLLNNAIEYTPDGGRIETSISFNDSKTILIKVSDTGYGIPKYQQDKIFTKLFRADNVKKKDTKGTGLGLYIAKSIINNMGGEIWFESEENKGTTFYVTLPFIINI
jgi:two-component system sensor histidine kinase VicK